MHPTMEYAGQHYPVKECATCGATAVRDYDGRLAVGGYPGHRVFSWHCVEGHQNSVPSDEISVLLQGNQPDSQRWRGRWRHVVIMHKMPSDPRER